MKKLLFILAVLVSTCPSFMVLAEPKFDLQRYKGKVVYVDFWASWCTPCRASFPFMQDMAEKHGESLVIVAINVDKERIDADQFLNQFDVNFDIVYDPEGALAKSFDVKGMPTSYLYGRDGQLIGSHIGFKKKDIDKLDNAITTAIDAKE